VNTTVGLHSARRGTRPFSGSKLIVALLPLLGLGGCAYVDTVLQRSATPDERVQLGGQHRVSLRAREIPHYTCEGGYLLRCDRGGSSTYSCTCAPR
jgi:hypothetical protein